MEVELVLQSRPTLQKVNHHQHSNEVIILKKPSDDMFNGFDDL